MQKSQYILVAVALVAVLGIYLLPKVVVSDKTLTATTQEVADRAHATTTDSLWNTEMVANLGQNRLEGLDSREDTLRALGELIAAYQAKQHYDSAAFLVESVALQHPQVPQYRLLAGETYYDAYTFAVKPERVSLFAKKAQEHLIYALDLLPEKLDAKVKLGMTYVSTENPMQGILIVREVLQSNPTHELALFNLGVLSMQSGQFDKALERFETLEKIDPKNLQVVFYKGVCLKELGKKEEATQAFQHVLVNTDDPQVRTTVQSYLDGVQ